MWHVPSCHGMRATRWMGGRWEVSVSASGEDGSPGKVRYVPRQNLQEGCECVSWTGSERLDMGIL